MIKATRKCSTFLPPHIELLTAVPTVLSNHQTTARSENSFRKGFTYLYIMHMYIVITTTTMTGLLV